MSITFSLLQIAQTHNLTFEVMLQRKQFANGVLVNTARLIQLIYDGHQRERIGKLLGCCIVDLLLVCE